MLSNRNKIIFTIFIILFIILQHIYIKSLYSVPDEKKIRFLSINTNKEVILASGYLSIGRKKIPIVAVIKDKQMTIYQFNLPYTAYIESSKMINGYIYSIGTIYVPGSTSYDILFIKFKPPDKIAWIKTYGGYHYDSGSDFIQVDNNTFILVGNTYSYSKLGDADILLIKTTAQGKILKNIVIGVNAYDDTVRKIKRTNDKNYILLGETWSYNVSMSDVFLVKINNNLDVLWSYSYGSSSYEEAIDLIEHNEIFWIIGVSRSFILGGNDGFLLRTDKNGQKLSIMGLGSNDDDGLLALGEYNNTIFLLGYIRLREDKQDAFLALTNINGKVEKMYLLTHENFVSLNNFKNDSPTLVGEISDSNDTLFLVNFSGTKMPKSFAYYSKKNDDQIGLLDIKNYRNLITLGDWYQRKQSLTKRKVTLLTWTTNGTVTHFVIPEKIGVIKSGEYVKKVNWIKKIQKTLENNVPLVIMSIPFIALIIAAIILKTKKIFIKYFT